LSSSSSITTLVPRGGCTRSMVRFAGVGNSLISQGLLLSVGRRHTRTRS
jgi:hypothetical protein